jgi:carbamoyl-phosphate synthase large subunit
MGFSIYATRGTGDAIRKSGTECSRLLRVSEGSPNVIDMIKNDGIDLMINTPLGKGPKADGSTIRTTSSVYGVPLITTLSAAQAAVQGIEALRREGPRVKTIQEYHRDGR